MSSPNHTDSAKFVTLLTKYQPDLWAYIVTLMPGSPDASDVLQKVNIVLWTKQKKFELGTNFRAWAFSIARFEVMAHYKRLKRDKIVLLDDELLETMTQEAPHALENTTLRLQALEHCLGLLRPRDRQLINHRYGSDQGLDELAGSLGRSASALSVSLYRLRSALKDCVKRKLQEERVPE